MRRLWTLIAIVLLALPCTAYPQSCPDDSDAFRLARRSRRLVDDYQRLHTRHVEDLARNVELYVNQVGERPPWSAGAALIVDYRRTFNYGVCTNQGPWTGDLSPTIVGAIVSLELHRLGVGVEGFLFLAQDRLTASPTLEQTRTPDGGFRDPTGLANVRADDVMYGGRLSFRDLATVVGGVIHSSPAEHVIGVDGRELLVGDLPAARDRRLYLGAGSPRYHAYSHLIFDAGDVGVDNLELGVSELPLPWAGLEGSASLAYIEDEAQGTLHIGVSEVLGLFTFELGAEHRPVRLRHARARVDVDTSLGHTPTERVARPEDASPRIALDLGAFAELSYFSSRYLEDRTGKSEAIGAYFGVFARPDLTILMTRIDLYFGVNRPEQVAKLAEAAGHWELGVVFHGRLGL